MNSLMKPKVILIALVFSSVLISCKKEEAKVPPPMRAPFIEVKQEEVPIYKDFAAQTFGDLDIDLTARVDGIVTGIYFKEGQRVKKGQLLYTIDPLEYDTKVDQAQGQTDVAESNLINAKEELNRIRPLAVINAVSVRDLDAAVAREKAAKSSYLSSKAALKNQELVRSYCNIVSPIDGVIGISIARLGDYISRLGTSSKLNTVSKLDDVRVRFTISEADYLRYQKNKAKNHVITDLSLLLSDGSTHPHKGTINFSDASIDPSTGTMTIEAQFANPDNTLRSGQFSKVRILTRVEKNAIAIPQKAITEIQGIYQVYKIDSANKIQLQIVEVSTKVGDRWVVTKGVNANDKVAIIGSQFIQPGSTVIPVAYVEEAKNTTSAQNN
jgi:membrane fusion protein (multidrug efflux system)